MTPNDPRWISRPITFVEGIYLNNKRKSYDHSMQSEGEITFLVKMTFWHTWPQITPGEFLDPKLLQRLSSWLTCISHMTIHYDNLSLKITLKNYSYSENFYYKRKCCTENFSVLFQCNFQRCLCLTWWERFKIGFSHNNSEANRIIIGFKFSVWL